MQQRAYSLLTIKSVDDAERIITGIATTVTADRMGDIVEPKGAEFTLPLPLLWQHRSAEPIGEVFDAKVTADGIQIKARVAKASEPGKLKDRLDEAWQSMAMGLVKGLSIGFSAIEYAFTETGIHFQKWAWHELSAVTIPANAEANIATLKSFDTGVPAATGRVVRVIHRSGASDTSTKAATMKSLNERIADFETTRAAKATEMEQVQQKAIDEGRTKDTNEQTRFDELKGEIKGIDKELADLRDMEEIQKGAAKPVAGPGIPVDKSRDPQRVIVTEKKLPPGVGFARYVACKAAAAIELKGGNLVSPLALAKARYPDDSQLRAIFEKAAVAGGTTSGSHAFDDLVPYQVLQSDFIDYLRPMTIIGQFGQNGVPALRRVPFNIRVGGLSAGATGYWKGEGKPIPVSKATSANVTLAWATVAGLTVITQELVKHSTPSAELNLRDDLAAAVVARMDIDFVDPTKAASANVSPASITYGVAATTPSGTAAVNVRHDLAALLALFAGNNLGRKNLVLIMSDTQAGNIAMMVNTLGNSDFPEMDLSATNPRLRGIPVIVSEHLTSVGSPSTQTIVLVKADEVYLADDGNVAVDASMEASIEMLDSSLLQDATNGTGASLVNMWQTGSVALRAEREINWKLRRSTAVQYISPAAYVPPTS
jgi:HK97 family phage major capsid protein/HK97 family phage prohead protease